VHRQEFSAKVALVFIIASHTIVEGYTLLLLKPADKLSEPQPCKTHAMRQFVRRPGIKVSRAKAAESIGVFVPDNLSRQFDLKEPETVLLKLSLRKGAVKIK
jgi:hypothetical protein